jgi:hypothetical protein
MPSEGGKQHDAPCGRGEKGLAVNFRVYVVKFPKKREKKIENNVRLLTIQKNYGIM